MAENTEIQRAIARIALDALSTDGFVLAGSSAIREHGMIDRPTEDIDLFTSVEYASRFGQAVNHLIQVFDEQGLSVSIQRQTPEFARLIVCTADNVELSIDLGIDWRGETPVVLDVGPVLGLIDAIGSKIAALFSRGEVRDFLDVDSIRRSGNFTDEQLLVAGERFDPGFDRDFFSRRLESMKGFSVTDVSRYGVTPTQFDAISQRLLSWAADIRQDIQQPKPVLLHRKPHRRRSR